MPIGSDRACFRLRGTGLMEPVHVTPLVHEIKKTRRDEQPVDLSLLTKKI